MSYFCTESDDPDHSLAESDSSISILSNVDNHRDFDVYSVYTYLDMCYIFTYIENIVSNLKLLVPYFGSLYNIYIII